MDKKQQIIDLWRTSFDDSEEFIDLYFDRIYKDENTVTIEIGGKIVSALQMLPYTMTYYGKEISVSYIYGACTLPSERGKGLMRQLIQDAFKIMKSRNIALSVIVPAEPWLFEYYRNLGFTEAFDFSEKTYHRSDVPVYEPTITVVPPEVPSLEDLYKFFDRKLRERTCGLLHTYDDFVDILRDVQISGGQVLTALDIQEKPVGMAFLYPAEKKESESEPSVYIRELLFDDDHIRNLLLQEATIQNGVKKAIYRTPMIEPESIPMGMARVIDKDRLIHIWTRTFEYAAINIAEMKVMDIPPLTRLLLGYQSREAYMSLMLD